jgi:hypothetical protein
MKYVFDRELDAPYWLQHRLLGHLMNAVPTAPHLYFPLPDDPEDPALLGVGRVVDAGLGTTGAFDDDAAMDVRVDRRDTGDRGRKRRGRG